MCAEFNLKELKAMKKLPNSPLKHPPPMVALAIFMFALVGWSVMFASLFL